MKIFLFAFYLVTGARIIYAAEVQITQNEAKNLHGKFERMEVGDLKDFRNQVTGQLYDLDTEATCTATLIGPRHVLTAAHCVYNFSTRKWDKNSVFIPGRYSKDEEGKGQYSYKRIFLQKEYMDTMKEEFDFAVVELDLPIGDTLGWAGFRSLSVLEMKEGNVFPILFSGYPGDKEFGSLWTVTCPGTINGQLISYYCDSFAGMSGSALFQPADNGHFVIGVHTWGGPEKNGGVYIDSKNYVLINAWKNSKKYPENTFIYRKP